MDQEIFEVDELETKSATGVSSKREGGSEATKESGSVKPGQARAKLSTRAAAPPPPTPERTLKGLSEYQKRKSGRVAQATSPVAAAQKKEAPKESGSAQPGQASAKPSTKATQEGLRAYINRKSAMPAQSNSMIRRFQAESEQNNAPPAAGATQESGPKVESTASRPVVNINNDVTYLMSFRPNLYSHR